MSGLGGGFLKSARKRMSKGSYWRKIMGLHPDSYDPSKVRGIWEGHIADTTAWLQTDAGKVVRAIFSVIPVAGLLLEVTAQATAPLIAKREQAELAANLARADLAACRQDYEECPETWEALWFAEEYYGTTMTPGVQADLLPGSKAILSRFLEDGGDPRMVLQYLAELEKRRTAGKFDQAVAAARGGL